MKWRSIEKHSPFKFYLLKPFIILRIKETKAKAISLYQPVSKKEVELSQALDMFCHNTHKNGQNDTGNSKPMEKQIHLALLPTVVLTGFHIK